MRSASPGLGAWLVQRVSAVYMLLFIVFVLVHFVVDPPHSYPGWHGWIMGRSVTISSALFFLALLAHAWVGLRDVIADYVHQIALRVGLLVACTFALTAMGGWVMQILWMRQG
jgi:succinate dehydrogenase / fumarate reductase membrane anchor subunit